MCISKRAIMLETDEVDIDYFTPVSGTSLAKIFSSSQVDSRKEASLKYVPPLPTQITDKQEETKLTQCIYASAFHVYEWSNNTHVAKGKLGFAIMKITQTGVHNMVIYNSEKTTLSCVSLNPNVTLNIDREHRISYYDINKRYWSIYTTQPELQKIIDIMKQLNVQLKYSTEPLDDTPNEVLVENLEKSSVEKNNEDRESDTDSSLNNKRTKDIILKRMATMGQSVLPPSHITVPTSDSSDSNEAANLPKIRHKPFKMNSKKYLENKGTEDESKSDTSLKITAIKPIISGETNLNVINVNDQQIVPITRDFQIPTHVLNEGTNMNIYISEQRVTNSELRLNMNKMSDKLDVILDKVNMKTSDSYQHNSSSLLFQNDIVSKLLGEYESKIKRYEEFLKLKGFDNGTLETLPPCRKQPDVNISEDSNLDIICKRKDDIISQLNNEVQRLSAKCEENTQTNNDKEIVIKQEIRDLKQEVEIKSDEIIRLTKKLDSISNETDKVFNSKLKEVMNDTFQIISRAFDNNETYSGTDIKNVVASVIKKTTMNALLNEIMMGWEVYPTVKVISTDVFKTSKENIKQNIKSLGAPLNSSIGITFPVGYTIPLPYYEKYF